MEGWPGCSIPASGCGGEGDREGEWRGPREEGAVPHLPQPAVGQGGCPVPAGLSGALPRGPDAE